MNTYASPTTYYIQLSDKPSHSPVRPRLHAPPSPSHQGQPASGTKISTGASRSGKGVSRGRRALRLVESSSDGSSLPLTAPIGDFATDQVPVPPSGKSQRGVVDGLEVGRRGQSVKTGTETGVDIEPEIGAENRELFVGQQLRREVGVMRGSFLGVVVFLQVEFQLTHLWTMLR